MSPLISRSFLVPARTRKDKAGEVMAEVLNLLYIRRHERKLWAAVAMVSEANSQPIKSIGTLIRVMAKAIYVRRG